MSAALACKWCGKPLAGGPLWGTYKCADAHCPEFDRMLYVKPTQHEVKRKPRFIRQYRKPKAPVE